MPPKTEAEYVADAGSHCPYCGNRNIVGDDMNFEGGAISQEIGCDACGAAWYDVYYLVGYEERWPPTKQE